MNTLSHSILRALLGRPALVIPERIELPGEIVITHENGITMINAKNDLDVLVGQGYLAGLHRPFQMEMNRRTAAGRLSEILGEATVNVDRWICRVGLPEAVEASFQEASTNPMLMSILEQYSKGVSLAWEQYPMPSFEFALLGFQLEPWTPKDCLRIVDLLSWSLAGNWEEQLVRVQVASALGAQQAAFLEANDLSEGSAADEVTPLATAYGEALSEYQAARKQAPGLLPRRSGSNAFVVSGNYTDSGKPIIAADPHLPLGLPGWFFSCSFKSATSSSFSTRPLRCTGSAIPGIPGIVSGRNEDIAWSITTCGAITAEAVIEKRDVPTRKVQHTIQVKQATSVQETIEWTERGPLIKLPTPSDEAFSLRWVGHRGDGAGTIEALWQLNHATTTKDVQQAAHCWSAPVINLVWAEVEKTGGTFGCRVAGRVPLRTRPGDGFFPSAGWIEDQHWNRYIPAEELPEDINPACGFIVSSNQRLAPADYPYAISHEYVSPYRAKRIEMLIQKVITRKKYTGDHARSIQCDQTSLAALDLRDLIIQYVSAHSDLEQTAILLLQQWDGVLAANSAGAAILKVTESHLFQITAHRLFSADLAEHWSGTGFTPLIPATMSHWRLHEVILGLIMSQTQLDALPADEWPALFCLAFTKAIRELGGLQGKNPSGWSWGRLHQMELLHPLLNHPPYQKLPLRLRILQFLFRLSRGPFSLGGDEHTPWQTSSFPPPGNAWTHPKRFWVNAYQPAFRMVATENQRLSTCLPGGISGQSTHPWADDQLLLYLQGQLLDDFNSAS